MRILAGPTQRGAGAYRILEAIRPVLESWVRRKHGSLTFRLVQVLSGHGCFGRYLCHVARREATPVCHECGCSEDTAQHALEECPSGEIERQELVSIIGQDLCLSTIIPKMVENERFWDAMVAFSEGVITRREINERERERNPLSLPIRRTRNRRVRHGYQPPISLDGPGTSDVGTSDAPQ